MDLTCKLGYGILENNEIENKKKMIDDFRSKTDTQGC